MRHMDIEPAHLLCSGLYASMKYNVHTVLTLFVSLKKKKKKETDADHFCDINAFQCLHLRQQPSSPLGGAWFDCGVEPTGCLVHISYRGKKLKKFISSLVVSIKSVRGSPLAGLNAVLRGRTRIVDAVRV